MAVSGKVFLLLALLLTCAPETPPMRLPLRSIPLTPPGWQDGETVIYEVVRNDSVLFRRTTQLVFDEEGGVATVVVTNVLRSELAPFYFLDSTQFSFSRFSLKPLWCYRLIATEIAVTEASADFYSNYVELRKETVEGSDEKTIPIDENSWGIEMLQQLLRTLPLNPGLSSRLTAVVPMEFRTLTVDVTVLGTKLIKTPKGEFLCREIEITTPLAPITGSAESRRLRLAYELSDPHRLIAINDLDNLTETKLVDYYILPPDTLAAPEF